VCACVCVCVCCNCAELMYERENECICMCMCVCVSMPARKGMGKEKRNQGNERPRDFRASTVRLFCLYIRSLLSLVSTNTLTYTHSLIHKHTQMMHIMRLWLVILTCVPNVFLT